MYITRAQVQYLKDFKEHLANDKVIVLGDFAENSKFIILDELQGYQRNQQQCTLQPIITYHKDETDAKSELLVNSLCLISDDLNHDVDFVQSIKINSGIY